MAFTVLDIGAGSLAFARSLHRCNPKKRMLVLCGEPEWGFGPLFRGISRQRAERLIHKGRTGVKKITAEYDDFNLPDESLDLVTVNASHPFTPPGCRFPLELERCLKPGGLYFSSQPRWFAGHPPESFELVEEGSWGDAWTRCKPKEVSVVFPQSPFIAWNIFWHDADLARDSDTGYLYRDGINPRYWLFRKPE